VEVVHDVLGIEGVLEEKVGHALPVLEHGVDVPHGVDEVGRMVVELGLDQELHEQLDEGRVLRLLFAALELDRRVLDLDEELLVEEFAGCLGHLPVGVVD